MATQRLPAVTISLGLLATPVFSIVVSTLWLHEVVTVSLVGALAMILGAIAIVVTAGAAKSQPRQHPQRRLDGRARSVFGTPPP